MFIAVAKLKKYAFAYAYERGTIGIGIYSARNNNMKLFKFNFTKWFNLETGELQNILSYMITKKTISELEAEQESIQCRLNDLADAPMDSLEAATGVRNLRIANGLLAGAILQKTPIWDGETKK